MLRVILQGGWIVDTVVMQEIICLSGVEQIQIAYL